MSEKQIYVVLGMPRSGTSAIARSLAALGVNLGDKLQPADSRNPRGFYEDLDVMYKINRGVSNAWHYEWMDLDIDPKNFDTDKKLRDYKGYAIGLVCERMASSQPWGFKDPRTTSILPFWQSVFKAVNVEDRYVIVVRHPLAAAHSIKKFAHSDIESGLMLWIKSFFYAMQATQDKTRVVVSYELMVHDPRAELLRMHRDLGFTSALSAEEVDRYANDFIDKKLRHHEFTDDDLRMHPAASLASICIKMHAFAMQLAKDEIRFNTEAYSQAWQELKNDLAKVQPMLDYIENLRRQKKVLERQVRSIHKSLPWKIMYPLRVIDDLLRSRRKKSKRRLVVQDVD